MTSGCEPNVFDEGTVIVAERTLRAILSALSPCKTITEEINATNNRC